MIRSYSTLLFWLGMTIASSLMLYHTSDKVHALDVQLRNLNAEIEDEQKSLHVLRAEWVYLANPARIEARAKRHLDLQPTDPHRIAALKNMNDLLPLQDGVTLPTPSVLMAQTTPFSAPPAPRLTKMETPPPRTKNDRILAALNAGRINDHMKMEHAASAKTQPDKIGMLMGKLGFHP